MMRAGGAASMAWFERVRPWWIAVAVFLAAEALCGPWGDYPLNDDWMYARTVQRFAETGAIVVNPESAAAVVGQTVLAAPVIALFGFSHTCLRLLTLLIGALGLWCVDRLLRYARCPRAARFWALLVLALNPLYFYLSATFMTELWGYVPALLATLLWFHGRSRSAPGGPVVGFGLATLVGVLMGGTFWIRQSCVIWFGALVVAAALRLALDREWLRLRRSVLPLALGLLLCAVMVGLYFRWARATGNFTPQFSLRLSALSSFDARAWVIQSFVYVAYMSFFLAPLLMVARWRVAWRRAIGWATPLVIVSILGAWLIAGQGGPEQSMHAWLRRFFPYIPNVLFNAGVGPVNLAEVARQDFVTWPHWSLAAFRVVHVASVLVMGLWGVLLARLGGFFRNGERLAVELFLFGAVGAVLSFALTIQGNGAYIFDRYHFPGVLGGVLALGAFLGFDSLSSAPARSDWHRLRLAVPWLALSFFSVAGLHDHFRWNDARWALVREYLSQGRSPLRMQAGYEVNGWFNYDAYTRKERPPAGDGECCHCVQPILYCVDDTWWVGMAPPFFPEYRTVRSLQPGYWLTRGSRPVSLYRRD
jgi:hypothetical protein